MGLMLGMLAVGGLLAGGAFMTEQVYAQPVNTGTAAISDDDEVSQSNAASIYQSPETACNASVDDSDGIQAGDSTNTAANDCDSEQTASVSQANTNEDDDVQIIPFCQSVVGIPLPQPGPVFVISCNVD